MSLSDNLYFILVEPQMGENIGAVARVISNFGFTNLRIISPRDGWPNAKADELAAHGKFVLEQAEVFNNFKEAIADINFLIATSAQRRDMEKKVYDPCTVALEVNNARSSQSKIGIMLGRERSGLTNEEIVYADVLCSINTSSLNSSLNLSQAACVIAYELSSLLEVDYVPKKEPNLATKADMESFFRHLKSELNNKNYFKIQEKEEKMFQNIRNIFTKAKMTEQEVRTLRGMIRELSENKNEA